MKNPFKNKKDFENAVIKWEEIRREGRMNMWGMGSFWDKKEILYVMEAYENGEAQKIIAKRMP